MPDPSSHSNRASFLQAPLSLTGSRHKQHMRQVSRRVPCCSPSLPCHTHVQGLHSRRGWTVGSQLTEMRIVEYGRFPWKQESQCESIPVPREDLERPLSPLSWGCHLQACCPMVYSAWGLGHLRGWRRGPWPAGKEFSNFPDMKRCKH